jgi:excinuclease ABC subunit C
VLYVGKAGNLKKRVSQYFQKSVSQLVSNLLRRSSRIDWIITENEKDALLMEFNLVHQHLPPFNIRLKDDKTFPYIEISLNHPCPGILYTRNPDRANLVVGPLSQAGRARELIDLVTRLFRIRQCLEATFRRGVPCLYFHLERCSAPCAGKIAEQEYDRSVRDAVRFLQGQTRPLLRVLEKKMRVHAAALRFEEAQRVKDDLQLLRDFSPRSYVSAPRQAAFDVIAIALVGAEAFFVYFSVSKGKVRQTEYLHCSWLSEDKEEALADFLCQLYGRRPAPAEVVLPFRPAQTEVLERVLAARPRVRVRFVVPQRGSKRKLLDLAVVNLEAYVGRNAYPAVAGRLQKELGLARLPRRIEGYDVSHIAEKNRVGALVVFVDGVPQRQEYRSFLIRQAGAGDTEALKEILSRHFAHLERQPDLLLVDGGRPQLSAALQVRRELKLACDVVALAKGEERIFWPGGSAVLAKGSPERHLFQNVRDEAHRRALRHHRQRREKIT